MQVMNQSENYEEEDYGFVEEGNEYDESSETTESELTHIAGIPKTYFIIGAIVLVLLLVFILVFSTRGGSAEEDAEELQIATETLVDTATTETTQTVTQEPVGVEVYNNSGLILGTVASLTDGTTIYDSNGTVVGTYYASTGSTPLYDSTGLQVGTYITLDELIANDTSSTDVIDTDTSIKLRKAGYTGDEIELAISTGTSVDALLEASQALRDEAAKEALARMSDYASPEFQEITNNTMYCMPLNQFEGFDLDVPTAINYEGSYIVNADYVKMPTYGLQLQLKCKIADGTYVFYNVLPSQWERLPETGNIVLNVTYYLYGTNTVNVWITNVAEMDVSDITVNPEDSAVRLQDIVNMPSQEVSE